MIDTISIDIDAGGRKLSQKDFCHPTSATTNINTKTGNNSVKHQQNIKLFWEGKLEDYNYLPEVVYMDFPDPKGGGQKYGNDNRCHIYRITFSAPKLVYGNNISEVNENMFESIVDQLHKQLELLDLPTIITKDSLRLAKVSRVDYGKNVILPRGTSMYAVNNVLSRAEHKNSSKFFQVQYKQGELVRSHIRKRAAIIYDKKAEYNASLSSYKPPMLSDCIEGKPYLGKDCSNILRFEIQIQSTDQLKRELKSLKLEQNTSFENVFSLDISRKILLKYWDLNAKNVGKLGGDFEKEKLHQSFIDLLTRPHRGGPQKVFAALGFTTLAKACGLDAIKQVFRTTYDAKSWRNTRDNLLIETNAESPTFFVDKVREAIQDMESLKLTEVYHD